MGLDLETIKFIVEIAVTILLTPLAVVLWYLLRRVIAEAKAAQDAVVTVQQDFATYKLYVAENYPTQSDINEIKTSVERLGTTLIRKLEEMEKDVRHMNDNFRDRLDKKQDRDH